MKLTGLIIFPPGKQWHAPKKAFRPTSGLTSYDKRTKERAALEQMKAKEKEMKDEKEEERQVSFLSPLDCISSANGYFQRRIQAIKEKRAKKEEAERYEKMAEKMHRKRIERLKRKEKRNKLINS